MTRDLTDHAKVDEAKGDGSNEAVFGGVVQVVSRGNQPRLVTRRNVLGDDVAKGS